MSVPPPYVRSKMSQIDELDKMLYEPKKRSKMDPNPYDPPVDSGPAKSSSFPRNVGALIVIIVAVGVVIWGISWITPYVQELPRPGETLVTGGILFILGFMFYPLLERILNKKKG